MRRRGSAAFGGWSPHGRRPARPARLGSHNGIRPGATAIVTTCRRDPSAALFFAADPGARPVAEELISAVGLEPVFAGDAAASSTVDALVPLWFALVRRNGGNRRVALRVVR